MEQLVAFEEAGATPLQILQAATVNAARLMGMHSRRGQIAPGFAADIIAVDGDPLSDPTSLLHVSFVMKDGALVRER
jgi:imidazolonepropionase-like amidohydrolase